ncbi:MAG TPA: hypothetical protein VFQ27_10990 [Xanthobacteraceae bacterium]|nr:hypothetical protein [Xanthobacteraceae bacterium]
MTVIKPNRVPDERPAERANEEALNTVANVEGEIREFVRKDVVAGRRLVPDDLGAGNLTFLVERVAGTSIREIERLIAELQGVAEYLRAEGERVQREIAGYAQASQAAMASAKIIAESMGQWKGATTRPPQADQA